MPSLLVDKQRMDLAQGDPHRNPMKDLLPQHIDHHNADGFGPADLERLIQHASKDLDEIDRQREKEFKEYEMRKEYERRDQLTVDATFSRAPTNPVSLM